MPNDKLREILESLESGWFFRKLKDGGDKYMRNVDPTDLMELPPKYREKLEEFVSSHSEDELNDFEIDDFIEQATGEPLEKALKILEVGERLEELEQDFV